MAGALEKTRTRKLHQFSIEALIGRGDNKTDDESCLPVISGHDRTSPKVSKQYGETKGSNVKHLLHVSQFIPGNKACSSISESDYHNVLNTWTGHSESSLFQPFKMSSSVIPNMTLNPMLPAHFSSLALNHMMYGLPRDAGHQTEAWLQARYSHLFNHRYPVGAHPSMFFHPYRKPKRNRTAFSPSQLIELEESFGKNHYVVGQERKELAIKLQLTETQVKVWFQNRRTKDKRVKGDSETDVTSPQSYDCADNEMEREPVDEENGACCSDDEETIIHKILTKPDLEH